MANPFGAGPYTPNLDALRDIELRVGGESGSECQFDGSQVSFTEVFAALLREGPEIAFRKLLTQTPTCEVTTASCKHEISGEDRPIDLFETLLKLETQGVSPFGCTWFYYAHDSCLEDPQESWAFFLLDGEGRVTAEDVPLIGNYKEDGPSSFFFSRVEPPSRDDQLWTGEREKFDASVADAYTQFYETARVGRIMVRRDDEPALFHYSREEEQVAEEDVELGAAARVQASESIDKLVGAVTQLQTGAWVLAALVFFLLVRSC